MGAGAGYNIKGTIDYDSIKINSFEVEEPFTTTDDFGNGYSQTYQVIPIKCDIDCSVEDIVSESYYYGGTLYGLTPIKITEMSLIPYDDDIEDISEITEGDIRRVLSNLEFDTSIGGGWTHSTFNGDISCNGDNLKEAGYNDFYFNEIVMYITNEDAIDVLDKYALGDNYEERYSVVDIDGNIISDDFYTGELDSAISFAKENNGYQVESEKIWCTYEISDDGNVYVYDEDYDFDDVSVEWTNPNYIDED